MYFYVDLLFYQLFVF